MINYYLSSENGRIESSAGYRKGCWIEAVAPDQMEMESLRKEFGVPEDFLCAALDPQESAHIAQEDGRTLVLLEACRQGAGHEKGIPEFETYPLSVIFDDCWVMTITFSEDEFLQEIRDLPQCPSTGQPEDFLLILMKSIALKFQESLRLLASMSDEVSERLFRKMNNEGLEDLMRLDKSLLYFSSSLQADADLLEKIREERIFLVENKKNGLLLYDLVEFRQASKMCERCLSVNDKLSTGCTNILSNNMNIVVHRLTVITIVLSVPALVFGFFGMNVETLKLPDARLPVFCALAASVLCWLYLKISKRY